MHAFDYEERELSFAEKLQIETRMKQRNYKTKVDRHDDKRLNHYIVLNSGEEFMVVMDKGKRFTRLADAVTHARNNGWGGYHDAMFRELYGERTIECWPEGMRGEVSVMPKDLKQFKRTWKRPV